MYVEYLLLAVHKHNNIIDVESGFETGAGAEQERVFSSAKHAMDKDQSRMNFDMLKMRTLLSHNKHLIRHGIINICD